MNPAKWIIPKMWQDGECWIIGGGPSMPRQFGVPESVIKMVQDKVVPMSVYAEYMAPIHNRHVIGINVAYLLGNFVSVLYFADLPFYRENKHKLKDFSNLKVTDAGNLPPREYHFHKNIKKVGRDNKYGLHPDQNRIRWNRNSGGGAIDLAIHFGAKRIMLLGYDMKADTDGKTHFHSGLPNYVNGMRADTFARFLKGFPFIKEDADKLGVEILNVNPDSALAIFPKVQLKDVI